MASVAKFKAYVAECKEIKQQLQPLAPVWSQFIDQAIITHDRNDICKNQFCVTTERRALLRGNVSIYYDDFMFKRQHISFIKSRNDISEEEEGSFWTNPRYAGVVFAMQALLLHGEGWSDEIIRNVTEAVMRSVYVYDANICIKISDTGMFDWNELRQTACAWLRALSAARIIQRAWRRQLIRKRAALLIQSRWRFIIARPKHIICQRRLQYECSSILKE